jgi:Holliday junction resolvase
MAQTPEGKVKAQVRRLLDSFGAYYFMPATGGYGRSGVPDFIGCYKGAFFAIECKAGDNTMTPLQEREMRGIWQAGGMPMLVNETNVQDIATLLGGVVCVVTETNIESMASSLNLWRDLKRH